MEIKTFLVQHTSPMMKSHVSVYTVNRCHKDTYTEVLCGHLLSFSVLFKKKSIHLLDHLESIYWSLLELFFFGKSAL